MTFWILYFIALIPLIIGGIMCIRNKNEFTWKEWIVNSVLCLCTAGIMHAIAVTNITSDTETWSGKVTSVKFIPTWIESYRIQHTVHHSSGSGEHKITWTTTYYTHHTSTHPDRWTVDTTLPYYTFDTDFNTYKNLFNELGSTKISTPGTRRTMKDSSKMKEGDPNDYVTQNTTGVIIPVNKKYDFENRVKAASTLFSFTPIPDNIKLPDYPQNSNTFTSDRLVGSATLLDIRKFDEMNSRLGPTKRVNVIFVGLNNVTSVNGKWLESKWLGGKKNDVVVVWGGLNSTPEWVYAFGWTDRKTVLRSLESIIMKFGGTNEAIPYVEKEIFDNYQLKNWHDFDYIAIPISLNYIIGFSIFTLVSQCILMWWYHHNDIKENAYSRTYSSGYYR